ncbi:hypothetical protein [Natranaeroarchaeum sulfidigenes]|uniref:DUF8098 domain-containing protein n=1 Tax=Natranaeroarchaeum sulfidigenes TaxID=2784880 RepID=A0A897MWX4_9EURY|nr:hypothetical protein [Natranaeroarchaeum sulfidigenes]QSG02825.1 hypothetical protein AArcS_1614 [Natranaeroarchaeum sulfidigenes]
MVQLTSAEQDVVDELLTCIAEAMAQLDDVDPTYANKTKLQKLLYLAIDEFDLPVTYSWYLAGAVLPGDSGTPTGLKSAFDKLPETETPTIKESSDGSPLCDNVEAEAATNVESSGTIDDVSASDDEFFASDIETRFTDLSTQVNEDTTSADIDPILFTDTETDDTKSSPNRNNDIDDKHGDIVDFYISVIPEVWHQHTMRFLQNFYLDHAPPKYRDLYVQSTHLRTHLRDIETTVADQIEGNAPDQPIGELVKTAELEISDLHCTIRSLETLSATFDGVVHGTDLIEDGLMMLAQHSPDEFEQEHVAAVRSMQDFFYYYVWRYPCLIISQETATGPAKDDLRSNRQQRLTEFESELKQNIERFEQELENAGLKPDYTDYPASDDEIEERITALADHYISSDHGQ